MLTSLLFIMCVSAGQCMIIIKRVYFRSQYALSLLLLIQLEIDMFKKPVKVSAQNQLSGKDRKTMKNKLAETYDEPSVDKILAVNDKIISCKISGSKMIIYNGNDYPLFVDGTGKNDYFPSLYTAIAYEPLIKVVDLNEGVESYIFNGANLMWPGVRSFSDLSNFQKDQVVGIRSSKGDLIAIGALGCSLKQLQSAADNSGVAVYILHYLNDKLWQSGPKTKPEVILSAQKPKIKQQKKQQPVKQQVKAQTKVNEKLEQKPEKKKKQEKVQEKKQQKKQQVDEQKQKKNQKKKDTAGNQKVNDNQKSKAKDKKGKKQSSQEKQPKKKSEPQEQSEDEADFGNLVHSKQPKPTHVQPTKIQKKKEVKQKVEFSDEQQNDKKKKKQAKKQTKKKGKKESDHEKNQEQGSEDDNKEPVQQKSVVSSKLMDQQFKQAFLNAIKLSKVQGELPIDSGKFYMDFMLLARPQGTKLEIKDTSYKKLGKFYEQMSKQKFIQFKHNKDKKGQQGSSIVKILWDNQQLKNYEPTILRMNEKDVEQKDEVSDSKKKLKLSQTLQVETAYKMHQNFKNAFFSKKVNYAPTEQEEQEMKKEEEEIKNQPEYYSQHQIKALIEKYINDKVATKKEKEKDKKQEKKQDKQKKLVQKMVVIDYKNNKYLAELLKKQIQQYEENIEADKDDSGDEDEAQGKKSKKKRQNIMKMDRGALVNRILKTCSTSYHIRDKATNTESFHQGVFKGIQLVAQKSNNKNITKILGLETFIVPKEQADEQINWLANMLKQKFASSVNVQNLPGKNAGKEIIVHGNFINQLEEMLTEEYKINEDYITSQNKLDKKKKR